MHGRDINHGSEGHEQGLETIFQTRHRCAHGVGAGRETPDIGFSFLLSHLNKGFHLESPFSGSWRQSCRHMAMDGWMDETE